MWQQLHTAWRTSWMLFIQGGLWTTGIAGAGLAIVLLRFIEGHWVEPREAWPMLFATVLFSLFASFSPLWLTLLSLFVPRRAAK